jgi:hypothetical protein
MPLIFPDDENGAVLRRMQESGDDLTKPRHIDFTVVFPTEDAARAFLDALRGKGYVGKYKRSNVVPELPWDVALERFMLPTHEGISAFEDELGEVAKIYGGRNDGWGCFERPTESH